MRPFKILLPDRQISIRGESLMKLLYHPQIDLLYHTEDVELAEAIVIPFAGRNRISPEIFHFLSNLSMDLPIIGFEGDLPENRDWPSYPVQIQLSWTLPADVICHSISRAADRYRKNQVLKRLQADYERRLQEIESMVEMGIEFTGTLSRLDLYSLIIEQCRRLIPADFYLFITVSPESMLGNIRAQHGLDKSGQPLPPTRRLDQKIINDLRSLEAPVYDNNPFTHQPLLRMEVIQLERMVSSMLLAPIISKDRLLGYIEICNRHGAMGFSESDRDRMEVLTDFAAVALENAYLYEKTELLAQIDDLTRLQNFEFGRRFVEALIREKDSFSMIFLDLDGFKKVNQRYGHLKGNEALQKVSEIIRNNIRHSDLAARFGGDEFMIVAPGSDLEAAQGMCRMLISKIEDQKLFPDILLSGSVGIARYPEDGCSLEAIIQAADSAMYYAKSLGPGHVLRFRDMPPNRGNPA